MRIAKQIIETLNAYIGESPPETGGILGSHDNQLIDAVVMDLPDLTNTRPCSYFPNVDFLNQNIKLWQDNGISFAGIFHAIKIYNQGYCYYTGKDGYPLNYNKALECFQKAAELGVSHAMNYLGLIYAGGEIVTQNYRIAVDWFYRAIQADSTNAHAAYNLSRMYYNGTGIEKDMEKAYQFSKAAVDLGLGNTHSVFPQSCYLTGCILLEHYNNQEEAYPYFMSAAKYGNIPEAWYNLGWLSEKGAIPVHNPGSDLKSARDGMARGFYEEAANLGYPAAMDAVGRLYATYHMLEEARPWIEKAASMGYEPAKKRLKMLNVAQGGSLWDLFK